MLDSLRREPRSDKLNHPINTHGFCEELMEAAPQRALTMESPEGKGALPSPVVFVLSPCLENRDSLRFHSVLIFPPSPPCRPSQRTSICATSTLLLPSRS